MNFVRFALLETSPHAWSKHQGPQETASGCRNISTCVEQTYARMRVLTPPRKHLHMRGANMEYTILIKNLAETSPHAWSKQVRRGSSAYRGGNISTCVEQTISRTQPKIITKKHLHMRGANPRFQQEFGFCRETSPHAWSKHIIATYPRCSWRNISTCVEQTQHDHEIQHT